MESLEVGYRWDGKGMTWRKEWEEEDIANGEEDDKRTMREVRKMSDSVLPFIKFKEEVASECKDGKLPMLDFQVWKEVVDDEEKEGAKKTNVMFEFYEKPVASKLVVMEKSALPHRVKITTLTQEIIRRMKNTCRRLGKQRRAEIITKFMKKMKRSGYSAKVRRNVALAGLKGYLNMVKTEESGGRKVNRPRWEGATTRRYKKLGAKSNWFRKKGGGNNKEITGGKGKKSHRKVGAEDNRIETIMFVPHTPGGELVRRLQEADDKYSKDKGIGRVKFVERGGTTLKQVLCRPNPWATEGCGRGDLCFPCRAEGGKGGNCQKEGIVYKITCQECKRKQVSSHYIGESSRTAFLRGQEHLEDLHSKRSDKPLWKHCVDEHGGKIVEFTMKVVRSHRTPLTRQIHESVEIENSSSQILMNSKGEYNGSRIPRIVIEVGDRLEDEWPGQEGKKDKKYRGNKKEEIWRINNMKKRKREVINEDVRSKKSECGWAQQEVAEPSVAKNEVEEISSIGNKRRKIECVPAQPDITEKTITKVMSPECGEAQSGECLTKKLSSRKSECGLTQHKIVEPSVTGARGKRKELKCSPAQPELSMARSDKNKSVLLVMEKAEGKTYPTMPEPVLSVTSPKTIRCNEAHQGLEAEKKEICRSLVTEIVGQIENQAYPTKLRNCHTHTQARAKKCETQTKINEFVVSQRRGEKRKLFDNNKLQPSTQLRRKRKKEETVEGIKIRKTENRKPDIANGSQTSDTTSTILKGNLVRQNLIESNRKQTRKTSKGGKSKTTKLKNETQKTKITQFFHFEHREKSGIMNGGGSGQQCVDLETRLVNGGGTGLDVRGED